MSTTPPTPPPGDSPRAPAVSPLLRRLPPRKRQLRLRRTDPARLGALRRHLDETAAAEGGNELARALDALAEARARIAALEETLQGARDDAEQVRRRAAREREQVRGAALDDVLRDVIPVYDNFERALASMQGAQNIEAIAEGVRMIAAQFLGTLSGRGVVRVDPLGKPFDPALHEALAVVPPADGQPEGIVAEVIRPGFLLGDRVVRPAAVKITKAP